MNPSRAVSYIVVFFVGAIGSLILAAPPQPVEKGIAAEAKREEAVLPKPPPAPPENQDWAVYSVPPRHGRYVVVCPRIIDGDTVGVYFLVGEFSMRIRNIDAPEMKDKEGPDAKRYLEGLMPEYLFHVEVAGRDKYGRIVGDVWHQGQKQWVSELMLKAGKAKRWQGK